MELFSVLSERNLIDEYTKLFDWIFDENKLPSMKWDNRNKVQAFTKALHKLDRLSPANIHYDAKGRLNFPEHSEVFPCIYMSRDSSEGKDWLRHIRNALAHGHVKVIYNEDAGKTGILLELLDFGKVEADKGGQTAYMLIPLEYLAEIKKIYSDKEKQWRKNKAKQFAVVGSRKVTKQARVEATVLNSLTPVSKSDIGKILPDVSATTIEAVLGQMVRSGQIRKIGTGRNTRYIRSGI